MKTMFHASWLLALAFVLPTTLAGSAGNPELTDAANDAPAPVDIRSAWFSPYVTPSTGVAEADCILGECDQGIRITLKLTDLAVAAPVADSDPSSLRYYYTFEFTPDTWGSPVVVHCVISVADIVVGNVNHFGPDTGVGTACGIPQSGQTGDAFDVVSSRLWGADKSQAFSFVEFHVDRTASTLTLALVEDLADVGPGTTFSGLKISTAIGGTKVPGGAYKTIADTASASRAFTL